MSVLQRVNEGEHQPEKRFYGMDSRNTRVEIFNIHKALRPSHFSSD